MIHTGPDLRDTELLSSVRAAITVEVMASAWATVGDAIVIAWAVLGLHRVPSCVPDGFGRVV